MKNPFTREMSGYLDLGMNAEARRLAQQWLEMKPSSLELLEASMEFLLREPDQCHDWVPLVETCYAGLNQRGQRSVRRVMLYFYGFKGDYVSALRFVGKRCSNLLELLFKFEGKLALDDLAGARKLLPCLERGVKDAHYPEMRDWLKSILDASRVKFE